MCLRISRTSIGSINSTTTPNFFNTYKLVLILHLKGFAPASYGRRLHLPPPADHSLNGRN